jgi:SNF2 family DNA or RNA helicase
MAALGEGEPFALVADLDLADTSEAGVWRHFLRREVPRLRAAGWRIQVDEGFDHRIAVPEGWYGDARLSGESGWFDFDLGVIVDGRRQPLLPLLHAWFNGGGSLEALERLADDQEMVVEQPDGRSLFLPAARLRAIVKTLIELCDPDLRLTGDALRLTTWRAAEVQRLGGDDDPAAPWRWRGSERLRALTERLEGFHAIEPLSPPAGFGAELRPYQREGLGWLQFLRSFGFGGILADDMGLGKTVQTLAHLLTERRAGRLDRPSLVVSPTSLIANWAMEAQRFAPELEVLTLRGPQRKARFADIANHQLVLTTYALALRDREALAAQPYHLLILDEAQAIKNPRAKVTRALASLEARLRLCLTGTPLENHLGELWSLVQFLEPGLLGDQRQFRRLFRNPIEKHGDAGRQAILQQRLAPIMLRRAKGEVLGELPDKTEIERVVELESRQRDLYETIRLAMHDKIRGAIASQGLARSQILILDALLKLRQVCCDPRLVKLEAARGVRASAKLALLMDLLPEMVEEGRRVLLFSQFTAMLALIEEALTERGLDYVKLTGRTCDRMTPIQRFQAEEIPIFLISLKAGGTGLNLTAADTVIHYDPWWNPAVQDQATDRAHRIGQSKKVFVYKLVTAGTVEQKILAMQARKRRLAESLFSGPGGRGAARFSAEDLERLFAPLD